MNYLVNNNKKYIKNVSNAIADECNLIKTIKFNNILKKYYKNQDYKFMTRENIFKSVLKILNI
jgi:hypothetical protein